MSPKLKVRKLMNLKSIFLACIVLISIGYSSLANAASIALNSSNWQGTTGAHYWVITEPGAYYLDVASPFITTHSFAIVLNASDIILDGMGKTITGSAVPPSVGGFPPPDGTSDKYGVRANAGIPSSGIQVKNLNVEKKYFGVIYEAVASGRIENVTANNNHTGIYIWDGDYAIVTGNTAGNNLHSGIVFDADACINSYNTVSNNITSNNGQFGILLWLPTPNSTITGNTANNNGNSAIALSLDSDYSTLTQNTAAYNANGIHVKSSNTALDSNTLTYNTNIGLWLESSNNSNISNNVSMNNQTAGIWLDSSSTNSLTTNNCDSNLSHGIVLNSSSNNNTLTGNAASGNTQVGIVLQSGSTSNTVTGHTANNNSYGIKVISSISNEIKNNTLTGNLSTGLLLETSANGNTISGNQITGNTTAGIWLDSSSTNSLTTNNCDSNLGHGIVLNSNSSNNTLSGNTASGNSQVGVVLQSGSTSNTITGHTANNNSNGIMALSSNSNSITKNTFSGNQNNGLWIESSSGTSITDNTITGSQNAGILLISSTNDTVSGNDINSHKFWGIFLSNSSGQTIYNNKFINPSGNAGFAGSCSNITWNTQKTLGNSIVGGPYLGGNFWGKPDGTGFSQVTADSNVDGICDLPHTLSSGNVDALPLHVYSSQTQTVRYVNPNDGTCSTHSPCHATIQDAINASVSGITIKLVQGTYAESFALVETIDITIEGGWDSTFSTQTPHATVIKPPTITKGSINFKEMLIRP